MKKSKLHLSGFMNLSESEGYTSKEILELRGAMIFIIITSITSIIGAAFQIFAGHKAPVVLQTISLYAIAVFFSCILYMRKKNKKGCGMVSSDYRAYCSDDTDSSKIQLYC